MKVLVFGATGMLGHAVMRRLSEKPGLDVYGTIRSGTPPRQLDHLARDHFISGVDVLHFDSLVSAMNTVRPDVVINCIGVIKQAKTANDPLVMLPINSMLPHRLNELCRLNGARLVHVSTDCVFDGKDGGYTEQNVGNATDLYGVSKRLGEVTEHDSVTLRTSIIGHELGSKDSLIEWFLDQEGKIKGFTKAIFSGLPTVELADVIRDFVLPNPNVTGLYHVAAQPVSKFDLLTLVSRAYGKTIEITPDQSLVIDRSLDGSSFEEATGYKSEPWPELVQRMFEFR
ncbi:MAG: dTDP-4-dehydrorhamnose reductase family protein [Roseobacter sp.]